MAGRGKFDVVQVVRGSTQTYVALITSEGTLRADVDNKSERSRLTKDMKAGESPEWDDVEMGCAAGVISKVQSSRGHSVKRLQWRKGAAD